MSRARRAQLKGRSFVEVFSVDFATCHYLPFNYRPGIGCHEWVEGLGAERTVYLKASLKPGPSLLFSSLHLSTTPRFRTRTLLRRAAQLRTSSLPNWLCWRWDRRTSIKGELLILPLGCVPKMMCLGHFIAHTRRRSCGPGSRLKTTSLPF